MIHILEMPKVREYDTGTIRVAAKNPLGEAECSTTLVVIPREDWRSRLKQAPKCKPCWYFWTCFSWFDPIDLIESRGGFTLALCNSKLILSSATVQVELQKTKPLELRSYELDQALKRPKTTVVELRALERCKCRYDYL